MSSSEYLPARATIDFSSFTPKTPVVIEAGDETLQVTVENVCQMLAPGAPPLDALKYLLTCRAAKINPFLGEAHLVQRGKTNVKWNIVITKAAYLRRAEERPEYDGFESGVVVMVQEASPTDPLRRVVRYLDVPGTILPPNAFLVGGWCKVYRKGVSRPFSRRVSLQEYDQEQATWERLKATMIEKVAVVAAHRDAFGIGDSYEDAELPAGPTALVPPATQVVKPLCPPPENVTPPPVQQPALDAPAPSPTPAPSLGDLMRDHQQKQDMEEAIDALSDSPSAPPDWAAYIIELFDRLGATEEDRSSILARRGVTRVQDLSPHDASNLQMLLEQKLLVRDGVAPAEPQVTQPAEETVLPEVSRRRESVSATEPAEPTETTDEVSTSATEEILTES